MAFLEINIVGDKDLLVDILINIGAVFEQQDKFSEALKYYNSALLLADSVNNLFNKSTILYNMAVIYYQLNNSDLAKSLLFESLILRENLGTNQGIVDRLNLIGRIFEDQGLIDKANEVHIRSLKVSQELGEKHKIVKSLFSIARNLKKMHRYKSSLEYLNQSLELAKEIGVKLEISQIYREMSLVFAAKHKFDSAEKYLDLYLTMRDSLNIDDEAISSLTDMLNEEETYVSDVNLDDKTLVNKGVLNNVKLIVFTGWSLILILVIGLVIFIFIILAINMSLRKKMKERR
jgi:tetratricopeptide (TPR) repeat protein